MGKLDSVAVPIAGGVTVALVQASHEVFPKKGGEILHLKPRCQRYCQRICRTVWAGKCRLKFNPAPPLTVIS